MALKTYDFSAVVALVGGVEITGFAPGGDGVSIKPLGDRYTPTVGLDGEPVHSRVNNDTYEVTLRLQAQSPSNAVLLGFHALDVAGNAGVVPVIVQDTRGAEIFACAEARVKRLPDMSFGPDAGVREWVLMTGNGQMAPGGYL